MKRYILTLLLCWLVIPAFSQKYKYEYTGRYTPFVKKDKLNEMQFVGELSSDFWRELALPYKERVELDRQKKNAACFQGFYIRSEENINYKISYYVVEYASVEISVSNNGKVLRAQSTSDKLTAEQKSILSNADLNTDINVKVKFKYKHPSNDSLGPADRIIEGTLDVTVTPEIEAEYSGGFQQLSAYLVENIFDKISEKSASYKIHKAVIKFTVNEDGKVVDTKLSKTSTDQKIDKLILDAINKMPNWKPAEDFKGTRVKQEFSIPLGANTEGC